MVRIQLLSPLIPANDLKSPIFPALEKWNLGPNVLRVPWPHVSGYGQTGPGLRIPGTRAFVKARRAFVSSTIFGSRGQASKADHRSDQISVP